MTIDHKKSFADSEHGKKWEDFSASETFQKAVNTAMLCFQSSFQATTTNEQASANWQRLEGARAFVGILSNLTTPAPKAPPPPARNNISQRTV